MIVFYALAIASAFLQTINGWLFWPAVVVVAVGMSQEDGGKVYWLAFVAGLVTDVLTSGFLGGSSIFLLVLAALIYAYRNKFKADWRVGIIVLAAAQIVAKFL